MMQSSLPSNVNELCQKAGHIGEWKEYLYYTEEVTSSQSGNRYLYTKHQGWKRTCERCGFEEDSKSRPKELLPKEKKSI